MNDNSSLATLMQSGLETATEVEALAQKAIERVGAIGVLLAERDEIIKEFTRERSFIYSKILILSELLLVYPRQGCSSPEGKGVLDPCFLDMLIARVKALVDAG